MTTEEINDKLEEFIESCNSGIYARINEHGRIQLDGYFKPSELARICEIVGEGMTP